MHEPLQLRAMGVGDLLDTTFRLYRRHFWLFVGIVAVVQVPLTFIQTVYQLTTISVAPTASFGSNAASVLIFVVIQGVTSGAMARAVSDRYLGQPLGLVDTYRALGWRWLRLTAALTLLIIVDAVIIALFSIIPCIGSIAALILLAVINLPILAFLAPVVVIENRGVLAALNRAFDLGRRRFWRLLGIYILLFLLLVVAWFALFFLITLLFSFWQPSLEIVLLFVQFVGLIVTLLVTPVGLCAVTLFYFDLRIRLEGFDLELMAARMQAGEEGGALS